MKRGTAMLPRRKSEVVGKTLIQDVIIAVHAKRENHYAVSLNKS